MKSIVILSLLVAVALAMPHEFAAHHASNPSEIVRRNKALLHRVAKEVKVHKALASKKLRVAAPKRFTLGAPVTFESYGYDMMCSTKPELSVKLNVGECKQVSPSFAVNISDWIQPPIHGKEGERTCASVIHHAKAGCQGEQSLLTFEVDRCEGGQFWGYYTPAAPDALTLHTGCDVKAVTDKVCHTCNATTHSEFNKCSEIPLLGSVKPIRVEKCSPVRLNLLTSCTGGTIYDSYALGQNDCFAGMMVRDGHQ